MRPNIDNLVIGNLVIQSITNPEMLNSDSPNGRRD
jgi:hypothetical protein